MADAAPFWKTTKLADMSTEQWESLCDGCGRCCLHKLRYSRGALGHTNVACFLLDLDTARCSSYADRTRHVPDCVQLTPGDLDEIDWLPPSCGYRLVAEGKDLLWWHPLVSGDPNTVHTSGASVRGRAISERKAGPLEHHLTDWPGRMPRTRKPRAKPKENPDAD